MTKLIFSSCVFICSYLLSLHSGAQTIKVVTENAPSLQFQSASGEMVGPAANLVEKVLNASGFSYDTRVLPWARAYKEAKQAPNTLIYSMVRTKERENSFHWIGIISKPQYYLFALKSTKIKPTNNTNELSEYSIATLLGSASYATLKNEGFKNLVPVTTAKQVFQLLTKKRVNLITANLKAFDKICRRNSTECNKIKAIGPIKQLNDRALYFALNKNSDAKLVRSLRETYLKMLNEKSIEIL